MTKQPATLTGHLQRLVQTEGGRHGDQGQPTVVKPKPQTADQRQRDGCTIFEDIAEISNYLLAVHSTCQSRDIDVGCAAGRRRRSNRHAEHGQESEQAQSKLCEKGIPDVAGFIHDHWKDISNGGTLNTQNTKLHVEYCRRNGR